MKLKIPSSYVLIFCIVLVVALATYILPSGEYVREYDMETGINYVVPDSYHSITSTPVGFFDTIRSIPKGMLQASDIILYVLIAGGCFGIIRSTGMTNEIIDYTIYKFQEHETVFIALLMVLFALLGTVFGMLEEALPLYPIVILFITKLGYDKITGAAIILLGTGAGFISGVLNPFTTGIAQKISYLPLFSGLFYRLIVLFVLLITSIVFVLRYAKSIKDHSSTQLNTVKLKSSVSKSTILSILVISISIFLIMYGIYNYNFDMLEILTVIIIMSILTGLINGLNPGRISSEFVKGASSMTYGAMIIGLSRAVTVVMIEGSIMDTVIYYLSKLIEGLNPILSASGMVITHSIINLFISSGSGQAAATMPIMSAIADVTGITRQTAVLAFQFGDGFSNLISPTSGYFLSALAISNIEWEDWSKWFLPLFILWMVLGILMVVISHIIGYGPY